jgi:pyruvate/2-oxoglutarate dehydrogenase complex dihydrolipoamide acyltransferase (E2) component
MRGEGRGARDEGRGTRDQRTVLVLPELGVGEGPIVLTVWLVKRGSHVGEGEPLVEVLAGAATVDLPSPADGILAEKSASVGDVLTVGQQLAVIESEW